MLRQLPFVCMVLLALINAACASNGKPINVKLQVVGNDRQPVADANIIMSFLLPNSMNHSRGLTDSNGFIEATENGGLGVGVLIKKDGYYNTKHRAYRGDQGLTLVLREKKNPIAMYAKSVLLSARGSRKNGEEFGYDLMVGDFVAPHGKGVESDLLITHTYEKTDTWNRKSNIDIRFSNPEDGFVPFYLSHENSAYKSDYVAPKEGYVNKWSVNRERKGKRSWYTGNWDEKRNYYFRVRTVVNTDGEVESAHYGKIYGEFPSVTYYLNPESNDRNVEFSGRSLFKNLADSERVMEL